MKVAEIIHGSTEHGEMLRLREEILRQPLGLSLSADDIAKENNDIHIGIFMDDRITACALVHFEGKAAHIRQVAVDKQYQGSGLGALVMAAAEKMATERGARIFKLHARDSARAFYEKIGYLVEGEPFEKLTIKHWLMKKAPESGLFGIDYEAIST